MLSPYALTLPLTLLPALFHASHSPPKPRSHEFFKRHPARYRVFSGPYVSPEEMTRVGLPSDTGLYVPDPKKVREV